LNNRKIVPITICCGEVYSSFADISIRSFNKHHSEKLYVLTDMQSEVILKKKNFDNICILRIRDYEDKAISELKIKHNFLSRDVGGVPNGQKMQYLSLKPIIMNYAIKHAEPDADYILSIDVDSYFSGNILVPTHNYLDKNNDKFDVYLVSRSDIRMHVTKNGSSELGTGYHLWKTKGDFIRVFMRRFPKKSYSHIGNQGLINKLIGATKSKVFDDPLLHFISPDLRNPNISDEEIKKIKPAYIHLHGPNILKRLERFKRVFEEK